MSIEKIGDDGFIVDREHVMVFQIHARIGALSLSISIGGRPGLMDAMARQCGSGKRTKRGVMEDYVLWLYSIGGSLGAQWGSVTRALGEERAGKLKRKCDKITIKNAAIRQSN